MRRIALSCVGAALIACASGTDRPHRQLAAVWRSYRQLPAERALAIAGDPRGTLWVTGASGGHASGTEAEEAALVECSRRRASRRMRAACVPYATADEIVWRGP